MVLRVSFVLLLGSGLGLRLVVEQQVGRVMPSAVGHHDCANGAGIDVLDLEEALDHVDIFRLDILEGQQIVFYYEIYSQPTSIKSRYGTYISFWVRDCFAQVNKE